MIKPSFPYIRFRWWFLMRDINHLIDKIGKFFGIYNITIKFKDELSDWYHVLRIRLHGIKVLKETENLIIFNKGSYLIKKKAFRLVGEEFFKVHEEYNI